MREKLKDVNYLYLFLTATVSFLWFVRNLGTAYDWPATDIIPMINRYFDSSYLLNDFFTNASSNEPNPRWPFVYLIAGLADLLGINWYVVLYALKILMIVMTPVLYYLVIYFIAGKYIKDKENLRKGQLFIFLAVCAVIYPPVAGYFSIAWWSPFFIQATPQSLALFLGLAAIVVKELNGKYSNYVAVILFIAATLMHFANGLFMIVFQSLINYKDLRSDYKYYISTYLFGFILTAAFIKVFLGPKTLLSTADFIDIYCLKTHPFHYHFSEFQSLSPFSWVFSFWLMFAALSVPILFFYKSGDRKLMVLSVVFLSSLILSVLFQYIFISVFQVKIIAAIGPVRFTQLIYWMIAILWASILSEMKFLHRFSPAINFKAPFIVAVFGYFVIGMLRMDAPTEDLFIQDKDVFEFIATTPKDAVFGGEYGEFSHSIQNIAKRPVFITNAFPFNEGYFKEHLERTSLLFGGSIHEQRMKGVSINDYYRKLLPEDFFKVSKKRKLDYVVVGKEFSAQFSDYAPKFENKKIRIYKVIDFVKKK